MTMIGPGVKICNFQDDPPMKCEGTIDGVWWWVLLWGRDYWLFNVYQDGTKAWDAQQTLFTAGSEYQKGMRPTKRNELIAAMKEIVVKWSREFREKKGPREWKPVKVD